MSAMHVNTETVDRIAELAGRRNVPVSALTIDQIAEGLGISRATLYRRIGSLQALHAAFKDAGHDIGEQRNATDRLLDAAAAIIRDGGYQSLTLEEVAARAQVALPTVFAKFGNRRGLFAAMFARYSPVPRIEQHLLPLEPGDTVGFRDCICAIYGEIWDLLVSEQALFAALVVEVLRDPDGEIRQFVEREYLPQVLGRILPWLAHNVETGIVRPLPPLLLGQQLVAPMIMHLVTRPLVQSAGVSPLLTRDEACERFADLYCAAVLTNPTAGESSHEPA